MKLMMTNKQRREREREKAKYSTRVVEVNWHGATLEVSGKLVEPEVNPPVSGYFVVETIWWIVQRGKNIKERIDISDLLMENDKITDEIAELADEKIGEIDENAEPDPDEGRDEEER